MNQYKTYISKIEIALFGVLMHINVQAAEVNQLDKHVHGLSELTVAFEQQTLEIELFSPAVNLMGFEHIATTETDIAAVKKTISELSDHEAIFSFSGGDCVLVNHLVDVSAILKEGHVESIHEGKPHQHHNHNEVSTSYRYHCKNASSLSAITVKVFDLFNGINQIETTWLSETAQGSVLLSPTNKVINLRQ